MANDVLIFAEYKDGQIKRSSCEAIREGANAAQRLGGNAIALLLGSGAQAAAPATGEYGAQTALVAGDAKLDTFALEALSKVASAAIEKTQPALVLFPATTLGKELAPHVCAARGLGMATDCTGLAVEGGVVQATRPVYAGKAFVTVKFNTSPAVATLRPNVFPAGEPESGKAASVETLEVALEDTDARCTVTNLEAAGDAKQDLTEANRIVSGGRGLKGPEHFEMLEKLADELGAVVGASRAVVDAGWRPHAEQVGQTGKTVSPSLYFACAISGAIQHLAGMRSSKCIVAINKDPDAPIFKVADYGIVGDVFEVVPALTEALQNSS